MATKIWLGAAAPVAQINTITPANVNIGNTFTVTINTRAVTVTATAGTVANVTGLLATALTASTFPEFQEVTWTDSTTCVTATAKTAGTPFTNTSSASGGTATNTTATTTANTGPNNWDNASNWSASGVPASSDTVYIENSAVPILYGFAQSAVTLTALNIAQNYTGTIGLPATNSNGYPEYRTQALAISATALNIGKGDNGAGSGRINLVLGSNVSTMTIFNTGTPAETNRKAVNITGTHASNVATIMKGSVAFASAAGETATLLTLNVGAVKSGTLDVLVGSGVTITTLNMDGGNVVVDCNCANVNQDGGTLTKLSGTIATAASITGGLAYFRGSGTIAQLDVYNATVDFSQDPTARTVTLLNIYEGATVKDPSKTLGTVTGSTFCDWNAFKWDMGDNQTFTIG